MIGEADLERNLVTVRQLGRAKKEAGEDEQAEDEDEDMDDTEI